MDGLVKAGKKVFQIAESELAQDEAFLEEAQHQTGSPGLACQPGCAFCCMQPVGIALAELPPLVAFVCSRFESDDLADLQSALSAQWESTVALRDRASFRGMCALNRDGLCTVYEARPVACRGCHSFDVDACRKTYAEGSSESSIPFSLRRVGLGLALKFGQQAAFHRQGLGSAVYDLAGCLSHALAHPDSLERMLQGDQEFEPFKLPGSELTLA